MRWYIGIFTLLLFANRMIIGLGGSIGALAGAQQQRATEQALEAYIASGLEFEGKTGTMPPTLVQYIREAAPKQPSDHILQAAPYAAFCFGSVLFGFIGWKLADRLAYVDMLEHEREAQALYEQAEKQWDIVREQHAYLRKLLLLLPPDVDPELGATICHQSDGFAYMKRDNFDMYIRMCNDIRSRISNQNTERNLLAGSAQAAWEICSAMADRNWSIEETWSDFLHKQNTQSWLGMTQSRFFSHPYTPVISEVKAVGEENDLIERIKACLDQHIARCQQLKELNEEIASAVSEDILPKYKSSLEARDILSRSCQNEVSNSTRGWHTSTSQKSQKESASQYARPGKRRRSFTTTRKSSNLYKSVVRRNNVLHGMGHSFERVGPEEERSHVPVRSTRYSAYGVPPQLVSQHTRASTSRSSRLNKMARITQKHPWMTAVTGLGGGLLCAAGVNWLVQTCSSSVHLQYQEHLAPPLRG